MEESLECGRCGIIFDKYLKRGRKSFEAAPVSVQEWISEAEPGSGSISGLRASLFQVRADINPLYLAGRVIVFLVLFVWGWKFILSPLESNYAGQSFMHLVDLPFHEAGHIIFSPFGRLISVLGGSLIQLLVPAICIIAFLLKTRDTFAATVGLWWLGESFMDLAPYINDARVQKMILLGGVTGRDVPGYHDWNYLLRKLDMLRHDHSIASCAHNLGVTLILISFIWGAYILIKQAGNIDWK